MLPQQHHYKMQQSKNYKIVISGGGTGGHIFPAISIANAIKEIEPTTEILFVGANDRMEMQRVPDEGYPIKGLPIAGFYRKKMWKNFSVLIKIVRSLSIAKKIIKEFKPDVVVGVGGYASGPTLKVASSLQIPTLIQEQNSYAGLTNKLLAKKADKICVAYEGMERFFPKDKIVFTGNPVRQQLITPFKSKSEAIATFGLQKEIPTVLILGGSLGAQSINEAILHQLDTIRSAKVQFIWQTGKLYYERITNELNRHKKLPNLIVMDFIKDMKAAYTVADLLVSRSGAGSISEFCLLGKPVILVPSPNVAEDHQTQNALALVEKDAAILVKDDAAKRDLVLTAIKTIADQERLTTLQKNIQKLAKPNAAKEIAEEVLALIKKTN